MRRIICPFHKEDTPSMVIYPEAAYCFGCGKKAKLEEVGIEVSPDFKIEKEDIQKTLNYICTLPAKEYRGLKFPTDELFYYIVFPFENYYIKRFILKDVPFKQKYICPKGNERPLFIASLSKSSTLLIVEGEINAMSIAAITELMEYNIVSPGGSGSMASKYLTEYIPYDTIKIIADLDKAGVAAGLKLGSYLQSKGKKVEYFFEEEDANDILVKYGREEVRRRYNLGM